MKDNTSSVPDDFDPVSPDMQEAWDIEVRRVLGEQVSDEEIEKARQAIEKWNEKNLTQDQRDLIADMEQEASESRSHSITPLFYQDCCPRCRLYGACREMRLNADDLWECPSCHLQGHTACFGFFVLLETEGKGEWASMCVKASDHARGWVLTIADPDNIWEAFTGGFSGEQDLRAWLSLVRSSK